MNKKLFIGLVVLMSLALLGIIGMQYFWFSNSIRVKQAELNLSVNEAMRNSALKLENRETLQKLLYSLNKPDSTVASTPVSLVSNKTFSNTFVNNRDDRRPSPGNQERYPDPPHDGNAVRSAPPDGKYQAYTGLNNKYSINIDSIAFAEEMR